MSKREYLLRYFTIIRKLRSMKEVSFDVMQDYLKKESEITGYNLNISKRTFQRDLNEIRSLFNIDIKCNPEDKYFIVEEAQEDRHIQMIEAFDMFNTLNMSSDLSRFIIYKNRKPKGTEHFYGLLHAIKNRFVINFEYRKYWEDVVTNRSVEPYLLKESQSRWYLLAKDTKDNVLKTFGLDRITNLEISRRKYLISEKIDAEEMFKNCFGIINPTEKNIKPEEIILSFEPTKGKYIESFPLHHSQMELPNKENEYKIKLKLFITHDFVMELLSHGEEVKVLKPVKLKNILCKAYSKAWHQY
jgi:predicted DNA-binding transcriptional regulator YafY